jgi:hypothetical protein
VFLYSFLHTWLNGQALLNYFTFCRLFSWQQNDSSVVMIIRDLCSAQVCFSMDVVNFIIALHLIRL